MGNHKGYKTRNTKFLFVENGRYGMLVGVCVCRSARVLVIYIFFVRIHAPYFSGCVCVCGHSKQIIFTPRCRSNNTTLTDTSRYDGGCGNLNSRSEIVRIMNHPGDCAITIPRPSREVWCQHTTILDSDKVGCLTGNMMTLSQHSV